MTLLQIIRVISLLKTPFDCVWSIETVDALIDSDLDCHNCHPTKVISSSKTYKDMDKITYS